MDCARNRHARHAQQNTIEFRTGIIDKYEQICVPFRYRFTNKFIKHFVCMQWTERPIEIYFDEMSVNELYGLESFRFWKRQFLNEFLSHTHIEIICCLNLFFSVWCYVTHRKYFADFAIHVSFGLALLFIHVLFINVHPIIVLITYKLNLFATISPIL